MLSLTPNVTLLRPEGPFTDVIASRDINAGETIFIESSSASVPEEPKVCARCFKQTQQKLRCSSCKTCWYCSAECQKADWAIHKYECPLLKRLAPACKDTTTEKKEDNTTEADKRISHILPPNAARSVLQLATRFAAIAKCNFANEKKNLDIITGLSAAAPTGFANEEAANEALGSDPILPPSLSVCDLIRRANTYSMSLYCPDTNTSIRCLFPIGRATEHSCVPNAAIYTNFIPVTRDSADNGKRFGILIKAVARRNISKGEQITINYLAPVVNNTQVLTGQCLPYYQRDRLLRSKFLFSCECPLCKQGNRLQEIVYGQKDEKGKKEEEHKIESIREEMKRWLSFDANACLTDDFRARHEELKDVVRFCLLNSNEEGEKETLGRAIICDNCKKLEIEINEKDVDPAFIKFLTFMKVMAEVNSELPEGLSDEEKEKVKTERNNKLAAFSTIEAVDSMRRCIYGKGTNTSLVTRNGLGENHSASFEFLRDVELPLFLPVYMRSVRDPSTFQNFVNACGEIHQALCELSFDPGCMLLRISLATLMTSACGQLTTIMLDDPKFNPNDYDILKNTCSDIMKFTENMYLESTLMVGEINPISKAAGEALAKIKAVQKRLGN